MRCGYGEYYFYRELGESLYEDFDRHKDRLGVRGVPSVL